MSWKWSTNHREYLLGGLSACGACIFTNPLEVVKTRMQLQGELKSRGTYSRHYRNVFHAFFTIAKVDGLTALQKGLIPGLWYQLFMNGIRLGTYQSLMNAGLTKTADGGISLPKSIVAGAFAGCVGSAVGSPFYLVKTHLQSRSDERIAVGHQHRNSGMVNSFRLILSRDGLKGLWRGVTGAIPRVTVGSAVQLSTFSKCKDILGNSKVFSEGSVFVPLFASMVSGIMVVCCMTPFDVISIRLYNQGVDAGGRGLFYSGFADCFWKVLTKEGFLGFYKGWSASWFRLAPHTVISLLLWDRLRTLDATIFR